jgi:hypothetical protein
LCASIEERVRLHHRECCSNTDVTMLTVYRYFRSAQEGILITKLTAKNLQRTQVFFLYFFSAFRKNCEKRILTSSCLSVRLYGTARLSLDGYSCNLVFDIIRVSVEKISVLFKSDKNNGYVT